MRFQAILNLHKDVGVINGEGENEQVFDKEGNQIKIDKTKVAEEVKRLEAEYNSKQYQRDRASQYPSITDVVVALAEKEEGDDTMWQEITAQRAKVKADNPKPT